MSDVVLAPLLVYRGDVDVEMLVPVVVLRAELLIPVVLVSDALGANTHVEAAAFSKLGPETSISCLEGLCLSVRA